MNFRSASTIVLVLFVLSPLAATKRAIAIQVDSTPPEQEKSAQPPDEWVKVKPVGARAKFEVPLSPTYTTQSLPSVNDQPAVTLHKHRATLPDGTISFLFAYHDLTKKPKPGEISTILEQFIRNSIRNVGGGLRTEPRRTNKNNGRRYNFVYSYRDKRYEVDARLLLVGRRLYQANVIMEEAIHDPEIASKFLGSFKVIEPASDLPPRPPISK